LVCCLAWGVRRCQVLLGRVWRRRIGSGLVTRGQIGCGFGFMVGVCMTTVRVGSVYHSERCGLGARLTVLAF
jgi:hypothetical protein